MNGTQVDLLFSRIESLHGDVRYLRENQDKVRNQLSDMRADVERMKGQGSVIKWGAALILPAFIALVFSAVATALGL